jgi:hypothetical protein
LSLVQESAGSSGRPIVTMRLLGVKQSEPTGALPVGPASLSLITYLTGFSAMNDVKELIGILMRIIDGAEISEDYLLRAFSVRP